MTVQAIKEPERKSMAEKILGSASVVRLNLTNKRRVYVYTTITFNRLAARGHFARNTGFYL